MPFGAAWCGTTGIGEWVFLKRRRYLDKATRTPVEFATTLRYENLDLQSIEAA